MNNSTIGAYGHKLGTPFATSMAIYFIFLTILGITSNMALIYIIVAAKRLHTIANVFIVNLAVCDLIMAALIMPFDAEFLLRGYYSHGDILCGFKEVALMFSLPSSVVNLLLLTLERFITVTFSFQRHIIFSKRNIALLIFVSWSYTLLVAIYPLMHKTHIVFVEQGFCWMEIPFEYVLYQLSANFLAPLLCIIILNILLFKVASKHEIAIRNQIQTSQRNQSMLSYIANMKAAKTVLLLVGVFTFCWLTFIILVTANVLCHICHPREVTWTGNAVNYLSVALNPLLFGLRNKHIRKEMVRKISSISYFSKWSKKANSHSEFTAATFYCAANPESANSLLPRTPRTSANTVESTKPSC
ncbi:alpha-1A adrenergic receptor-like [Hydractinia symbiolongicarpus]|uniref:alpha-1A adrenergic receptor-like n=1 Tax=Hydractinia symbiolongicarpus TaxID=13093 RepID=UPI00254E841A|nr:alpha-1A adrenergic receptor-like [Hydractinia symbiolongicarpus]XP_057303784.1 alpha-1A adrenergic receptor-like [Hydractinia symbiolongicarpus]